MSGQYLVPLQIGIIGVISLIVPLYTFLSDNGLDLICNIFICSLSGLMVMGLIILWGHYIITTKR